MIHICVCDDDDAMGSRLSGLIQDVCKKHGICASVCRFSSGEELLFHLEEMKQPIDIYFLDILMKQLNGVETAARLRAVSPTAQIIFLTVSKENVFEALDVMPLHYLLKQDVGTGKIETVLLRAVSLAEKSQRQSFTYKFGKTIGSVLLRDIVYFEAKNRIIEIHLKNGPAIEFYGNIKDLEQQLLSASFERVHRSYIVNFENVDYLQGREFVCVDQTVIPIGQKYAGAVEQYQNYLLNGLSMI